jgi:hypothetical protein
MDPPRGCRPCRRVVYQGSIRRPVRPNDVAEAVHAFAGRLADAAFPVRSGAIRSAIRPSRQVARRIPPRFAVHRWQRLLSPPRPA